MKKAILSVYYFCAHTFIIFSVTVLSIALLGQIVGEESKEISTLFALGSKGLTFSTVMQLLGSSLIITAITKFVLSSKWMEKVMARWKITIMLFGILATIVCFILVFDWLPAENINAWIGFAATFGSGFAICTIAMTIKTKMENEKYERSFLEYKRRHEEEENDEQHHA